MQRRLFVCTLLIIILISTGCTSSINRAVYNNDYIAVDNFLKNGNDINKKDDYQRTPLIYAAYVSNNSMLKYLIQKGANLNEVDYRGCSALIYASYYGHFENVKDLLDAGANVFIRDYANFSAYEYAKNFNFPEVANLLKAKGADDMSKYPPKPEKKINSNQPTGYYR